MTSTDGFCSVVVFAPGELGEKFTGPAPTVGLTTPSATPTHPTSNPAPTKAVPTPSIPSLSPAPVRQPNSPTRTSSASSVATLGSIALSGNINNPTPTVGSLPSVAVAGVPLTTPPQTPLSATPSVLGKREEGPTLSNQEGGGTEGTSDLPSGGDKKRRRIAPTPVNTDMADQ